MAGAGTAAASSRRRACADWRGDALTMIDCRAGRAGGAGRLVDGRVADAARRAGAAGAGRGAGRDRGGARFHRLGLQRSRRCRSRARAGSRSPTLWREPNVTTRTFLESGEALRLPHAPIPIAARSGCSRPGRSGRRFPWSPRPDEPSPFSRRADDLRQARRSPAVPRQDIDLLIDTVANLMESL